MNKEFKNIILFIEPSKEKWQCPLNIGNIYLNRFSIDEEASFEVMGIHKLAESSEKIVHPYHKEYYQNEFERSKKENHDFSILASKIRKMAKYRSEGFHIVIAGHLFDPDARKKINKHILDIVGKMKISSVLVTRVCMHRLGLVSMETNKAVYKEDVGFTIDRFKNQDDFDKMTANEQESHIETFYGNGDNVILGKSSDWLERFQVSVYSDADALVESVISKNLSFEEDENRAFTCQKLSSGELLRLRQRDPSYLKKFRKYATDLTNLDKDELELKRSESHARFATLLCYRITIVLDHCKIIQNKSSAKCSEMNLEHNIHAYKSKGVKAQRKAAKLQKKAKRKNRMSTNHNIRRSFTVRAPFTALRAPGGIGVAVTNPIPNTQITSLSLTFPINTDVNNTPQ